MKAYIQAVETRLPYIHVSIIPDLAKHGIGDVEVFCDYKRISPLWNAKRIWAEIAQQSEPCMVFQDDIIFHKEFGKCITDIYKHFADGSMQAASFFVPPRGAYSEYRQAGYNFIENYDFLWLQGVMLSPSFCKGLLEYAETSHHTKHDDSLINNYCRANGIPVYNTLPSLIQHNLSIRSTMGTASKTGKVMRHSYVWEKDITANHFSNINAIAHRKPKP